SISHEAIYQYCYRPKNRQWCVLLPTRRKKRKRRCDRRAYRKKNPDVVGKKGISERPKEVDARVEEGHWEGDCIIGTGQRSAVAVFVERATRMTFIAPLARQTAGERRAFLIALISIALDLTSVFTHFYNYIILLLLSARTQKNRCGQWRRTAHENKQRISYRKKTVRCCCAKGRYTADY
ncbi:MAG: transposase, partial [Salinispira sp.]